MIIDYLYIFESLVKIFFTSVLKISGMSEYHTLISLIFSFFMLIGYSVFSIFLALPFEAEDAYRQNMDRKKKI